MKKIIRIIAIILGVILILLLTLPVLFKSKIEALVKEEVNKQVHARVDWSRFSVNFFRGFPDLSINLHEASVVGLDAFDGDTLVGLERFELRVSPFSAIKKNVIVKSILLDRPLVNGIILADGSANWDIAPVKEEVPKQETEKVEEKTSGEGTIEFEEEEASDEEKASMSISLKRFAVIDARIHYDDQAAGTAASVDDLDLEIRGDFAMENTDLTLQLILSGIYAKSGGIAYMKNGSLQIDLEASADMANNRYTLARNEIRINGLVLGAEGTVEMPEDGSIITDLSFFTRETSFRTLLSMVPAIYLQDFESLETRGSLALNGTVKGVMKDSVLPNATLKLAVSDGYFSYPDLPKDVSDVQVNLTVNYDGSNMDATTVKLERFHLLLGGNPFDISLDMDHPFSDMHVAGMVRGMIDFATLKDIIPMEDLELSGKLEADLSWDTKMSFIENEKFDEVDLDGKLGLEDVKVNAPGIPVQVMLEKMSMVFTPRFVNLETADLVLGSSDLHLDGQLSNFIPYVFDKQTVSGSLNLTSDLLDANELIPQPESAEEGAEAQSETVTEQESPEATADESPGDSVAVPSPFKIPGNIDFRMNLDMQKINYDNIVVENLTGRMSVKEGIAYLDDLNLDILEGNVDIKGVVDPRGESTEADVDLNLTGIDIPSSYETFVTVEKLAPVAKYTRGTANVKLKLFTLLDASFMPIYESIDAEGHLFGRNLRVEQPASLEKLSATLKNEKLRNLELEKADIWFEVRDGRVIVEPFDMNFDASKITVSGSHGIDQTMDYLMDMDIAKKDLGSGANELMNTLGTLASGAGFAIPQSERIKIKAFITGTFKDPKIRTDLSGNLSGTKETVRQVVEEKVKEEVQKVEEQVREEAGAKAEELIKQAEQEKARLIQQASEAGEKIKKEAKAQGDKLIKDAGTNPIKQVAAKKAADELNKQAASQSEKLILDAEARGDALIVKAREEASKI